jgi:hypothetical protein
MKPSFAIAGFALVVAVVAVVPLLAFSVMQFTAQISSTAMLKAVGIGVYSDAACSTQVSQINWGVLEPGSNKTVTVYIRNESNVPVALTLATADWNPVNATEFISLSWDQQNVQVDPPSVTLAILTLHVAAETTGLSTFTFTIIIAGMG